MRLLRSLILITILIAGIYPTEASAQRRKAAAPASAVTETVPTDEPAPKAVPSGEIDRAGNFRFGPLGLLIGYFSADLDFKLGDSSWTLGPSLSYLNWDSGGFDLRILSYGVRANYHFGRPAITQGWYLGPFLNIASVKVTDEDTLGSGEVSAELKTTTIGAISGYQWIWESFNINFGLGLQGSPDRDLVIRYSDGTTDSIDTRTVGLTGEFTLGWVF